MSFCPLFWSMGLASLCFHLHIQIQNSVLMFLKSCLKTYWISTHWTTVKIEFWEFFAAINFSKENNPISSKTVKCLGKGFSKEMEATWMERENSIFPGIENLALSFQKQTQLSLSANGPGKGESKFRNTVLMIHLPLQNPKQPSCLRSMGNHLAAIFSSEIWAASRESGAGGGI